MAQIQLPRMYQAELLEEAKRRNIIIRADTGTGKTLVALLLIRWIASQPCHRKPDGSIKHSIQVFIVPTRPLVHQQMAAVERQTTLRVKGYTGEMQPEFWKSEKWKTELYSLDVMVCTAQIFLDVLSKGYWSLSDVSLVVFDEAHHCRKQHTYNQIMTTHYHRLRAEGVKTLPRILGMTASPIWSCSSIEKAQKEVETLQTALAAQLYEVRHNREDVSKHTSKPKERIVYFDESKVAVSIQKEFAGSGVATLMKNPKQALSGFDIASDELGELAEVIYVKDCVDGILSSTTGLTLDIATRTKLKSYSSELDQRIKSLPAAGSALSPRIRTLVDTLLEYKVRMTSMEFRGIIFVERRRHAIILSNILSRIDILKDFVLPMALTGHGPESTKGGMDSKTQNKAVESFRNGEVNLIIATTVAEEGLDFPKCFVVFRFDQIATLKGYIQSRGRARAINSDYIVMIDKAKGGTYSKFIGKEDLLKDEVYTRPDDESIGDGEVEDTPQLHLRLEDGSEAILTYAASPGLLSAVCQLLPHDEYAPIPKPVYIPELAIQGFVFTVQVPIMAELPPDRRSFTGPAMQTKKGARRAAAFEACKSLHEVGVLTEHLLPRREDYVEQRMDAHGRHIEADEVPASVKARCPNPYGDIWKSGSAWLHKFELNVDDGAPVPFGLVCSDPLHLPPNFVLFDHLQDDRELPIKVLDSTPLEWNEDERFANLQRLDSFNRTGIQIAVNRRPYNGDLIFFVAPLVEGTLAIEWDLVDRPMVAFESLEELLATPYIVAPVRALHHRIMTVQGHCENINVKAPTSEMPEVPGMERMHKKVCHGKFKSLDHWFAITMSLPEEVTLTPLIYLDACFEVRNNLLPATEAEEHSKRRIVLPKAACQRSRLPWGMWRVFSFLPSFTRRIHDASQARLALETFDVPEVDPALAVEALTQPGTYVGYDYQTLETIGDAFLKMATSVHLYIDRPNRGEGTLSILRSRSVDNSYLRGKSIRAGVPGFVLGQRFRTDMFRAAHLEDGTSLPDGRVQRLVPRRVLSDVVEALLGATYISSGIPAALRIGTAMDLCFGGVTPWHNRTMSRPGEGTLSVGPAHVRLQEAIGYTFQSPHLLIQALTHRSANSTATNCYEREEWIGDAVVDLWITEHLYRRFKGVTAEQLTFIRAAIVTNSSLGFIALKKLDLHKMILHSAPALEDAYHRAIDDIAPYDIPAFYSDHTNPFIVFDPPKILGDAVEAIIGAVFVDSHFDLAKAYAVLDTVFAEVLPILKQCAPRDPLSRLLQLRDKHFCCHLSRDCHIETETDENGDQISRFYVCTVTFHDKTLSSVRHPTSSALAEQRASLKAGNTLADESLWEEVCGCAEIKKLRDEELKARKKREKSERQAAALEAAVATLSPSSDSATSLAAEIDISVDSLDDSLEYDAVHETAADSPDASMLGGLIERIAEDNIETSSLTTALIGHKRTNSAMSDSDVE